MVLYYLLTFLFCAESCPLMFGLTEDELACFLYMAGGGILLMAFSIIIGSTPVIVYPLNWISSGERDTIYLLLF